MLDKRLTKALHIDPEDHISVERRASSSFPLHAHEYYELEVIESGSGTLLLNGKRYDISRGSLYMLSPADFHEIVTKDGLTLWNISFDNMKVIAENELMLNTPLFTVISDDKLQKFSKAAELLLLEHKTGKNSFQLLRYILLEFCAMHPDSAGISPIDQAMLFIKTHFRDSPSLSDTADLVGLSPVYLGSLFKKTTGQSYTEYLTACKLSCAAMLLQNGINVTDSCFSSGFGSLSGFLYAFKKYNGIPPAEYKKRFSHDIRLNRKKETPL